MPGYACARFGGEGACPEDTHQPETVEGRAIAAADLILIPLKGAEKDDLAGLRRRICDRAARIPCGTPEGGPHGRPGLVGRPYQPWDQGIRAVRPAADRRTPESEDLNSG